MNRLGELHELGKRYSLASCAHCLLQEMEVLDRLCRGLYVEEFLFDGSCFCTGLSGCFGWHDMFGIVTVRSWERG